MSDSKSTNEPWLTYDEINKVEDEKARNELYRLVSKCEYCRYRFKCFTMNTSSQPTKLLGINFEVAHCCIRCSHSKFPRQRSSIRSSSSYRKLGKCTKHKVAVHWFSYCDDFAAKHWDNLTWEVFAEIEQEMKRLNTHRLPSYCVVEKRHIGEE